MTTRLKATRLPRLGLALTQLRVLGGVRRLLLLVDDEYRAFRARLFHLSRLHVVAPYGVRHRHAHRLVPSRCLCIFI